MNAKQDVIKQRQTGAYVTATMASFLIAALVAYSWTATLDNWFKAKYPDPDDAKWPRVISSVVITILCLVALKYILTIKKI